MRSPAVVVARNILRIPDRVGPTTGSRSGFSSDETATRDTEGQGISRCPQQRLKSHLLQQSWASIMAQHRVEIYNRNNAVGLYPRAAQGRAAPASRRLGCAADTRRTAPEARQTEHSRRSRVALSIPRFF